MDAIKAARELGKAIQEDERFKAYTAAKDKNDQDAGLQKLIGDFELIRQNLQMELQKPDADKDAEKVTALNADLQRIYGDVMGNATMAEFTIAKAAMDKLLQEINAIIGMCCEGDDPDTCEFHDCGGSCSTCGGCH